ncbi:MAG: hypothetical protein KF754_04620 [Planctomycetes bacterium]|nr:hypothetical protein [Planctomycetota bacterium]
MFELNLIKDKAKARQRRRVIFLSIVCVLFLSGLLAIFVGSLYWNETTKLNKIQAQVKELGDRNTAMEADLNLREPKAVLRRNGLIEAWKESLKVQNERKYFTLSLQDLFEVRPASAEFWYRQLSFSIVRQGNPQGGPGTELKGEDLLGPRGLLGGGYIEVQGSEVLTKRELDARSLKMENLTNLVGQPSFALNLERADATNRQSRPGDERQYLDFTIQAAQRIFSAPGGNTP